MREMAKAKTSITIWQKVVNAARRLQFTRKEQLAFLQDLASLVEDGVVAPQAVETIAKVSKDVVKVVAEDISQSIAEGQGLAEGMQPWFPRAVVEVVRAGEQSGALAQTLSAAAESFRKRSSAIKEIVNSLLYPLMVVTVALTLLVFVKKTVLESFVRIKSVHLWPAIGQHLYHTGYLLQTWWWFMLAVMAVLIMTMVIVLRNVTGRPRFFIDQVPLLSLYRDSVAARFMETLGLLLSNGIVLKKAFDIMQHDAPPYLAWHLLMMEVRLSGGKENIAEVLDTKLINDANMIRLRVLAKGKGFEHALLSLGRQSSRLTAERIGRISRITGGLLLIVTALIAAFVVTGIYNISNILAMM